MSNDHAPHMTERLSTLASRTGIDVGARQFLKCLQLHGLGPGPERASRIWSGRIGAPHIAGADALLFWVVRLAPLAFVGLLSFRIEKMSVGTAQAAFWGYASFVRLSLAGIFLMYACLSIARSFFITGVADAVA